MSRNHHKWDKFSKSYSFREYLTKAIKVSTNGQTIDQKDLDHICNQTDLQKGFEENLKVLVKNQINSCYEGFDLEKFENLQDYVSQ